MLHPYPWVPCHPLSFMGSRRGISKPGVCNGTAPITQRHWRQGTERQGFTALRGSRGPLTRTLAHLLAGASETPQGRHPPVRPSRVPHIRSGGRQGMSSKYAPAGCLTALQASTPVPEELERTCGARSSQRTVHGSQKLHRTHRSRQGSPRKASRAIENTALSHPGVSQLCIHSFGYAAPC